MVSFRVGTLIKNFLKGEKSESDLEEFIRQTRDPVAILFAMRIQFRYIYADTTVYVNGTVVNRTVEEFFSAVIRLGQNISQILNDGVNVQQLVLQEVQDYIQEHHVMAQDVDGLAQQIATLYLDPGAAIAAMPDIDNANPVYAFFVYFFLGMDFDITTQDMQTLDYLALLWVNEWPIPDNIDDLLVGITVVTTNIYEADQDNNMTETTVGLNDGGTLAGVVHLCEEL